MLTEQQLELARKTFDQNLTLRVQLDKLTWEQATTREPQLEKIGYTRVYKRLAYEMLQTPMSLPSETADEEAVSEWVSKVTPQPTAPSVTSEITESHCSTTTSSRQRWEEDDTAAVVSYFDAIIKGKSCPIKRIVESLFSSSNAPSAIQEIWRREDDRRWRDRWWRR